MLGARKTHVALIVLLAAACAQKPQETSKTSTDAPAFSEADAAAVTAIFTQVPKWLRAGDWDSWAGGFSSDGVLQPPNAPTVVGRDALLAWGKTFPAIESVDFTNAQVKGEGNFAYATSDWTLKVKGAAEDKGKQLVVFRRGADGKWEVAVASYSSDMPAVAPAK